MATTTNSALNALLYIRNGSPTARWNFPAAIGSPLNNPAGVGSGVTLTYSFLKSNPQYYIQTLLAQAFNQNEQDSATSALNYLANIANIRFNRIDGVGQLTFALSALASGR